MTPEDAENYWYNLELNTWKRGSQKAVHKPLLLLLLISRAAKKENGSVKFSEIAERLESLLEEFGSPTSTYHPEYPFWHLQNEFFWKLENIEDIDKTRSKSPSKSKLLKIRWLEW